LPINESDTIIDDIEALIIDQPRDLSITEEELHGALE
jgi:hypothetical protein